MRAVYKLANSSPFLPILTTNIIRALFLSLKDDSLVFLAGIITRFHGVERDKAMCVAALRHAASFLSAQPDIDFQTIIPSLIVAISGGDIDIRVAAMDCVAVVANHKENLNAVYGFDTLYGEQSGTCSLL
jgi:U3 small nucleolar RNA-associated protein 10